MCETDYSGYPDYRDDTLKALQVTLNLGLDSRFVIETRLYPASLPAACRTPASYPTRGDPRRSKRRLPPTAVRSRRLSSVETAQQSECGCFLLDGPGRIPVPAGHAGVSRAELTTSSQAAAMDCSRPGALLAADGDPGGPVEQNRPADHPAGAIFAAR